jgi:hypothetical protein
MVRFPAGTKKFFLSSPPRPDRLWGLSTLLSNGYRGPYSGSKANGFREVYPGVKRPRRETDHSPPSRIEVKNA